MKTREKLLGLTIATAITLVFILLFLPALILKIDQEIFDLSDQTFQYTKEMNMAVDSVLDHLENRNNNESLLSMRIELFQNNYIKDIFYFRKDYIILSSILGNLSVPQLKLAPDLIYDSKEIWFNHTVVYGYSVFTSRLIKSGNYGVLVNKEFYNNLDNDYKWELVLATNNGFEHFMGEKGLYTNEKNRFTRKGYYRNISFKENGYHMRVYIPYNRIIEKESVFLKIVLGLSVLVFIFSFYVSMNYERFFNNRYIRIKKGLKNKNFYFVYQPIIQLSTGEIKGMEVLARFQDKTGKIYPDEFIPMLIKQNKTWEFTKMLFNEVHKTLDDSTLNTKDFRVSINIFPSDIINMNVLQLLAYEEMIGEYNMFIEVIEDQYLEKKEASIAIATLKEMGFRVAIDDFGTGYSNLSSLKTLNIDYLKIDKSFIFEMEEATIKSSLIPHIIDISNSLKLSCVAEGIENKMQLQILKQWGIKYGQGYYFSKPVSIEEMQLLCENQPFKNKNICLAII